MARKKRQPIAARLRNTKGALLAVSLTLAGLLLMLLGNWIGKVELGAWIWLREVPLSDIGGTLLVAGLVGTIFDIALRRDQEEAVKEHFREIIKEQAPAMRDAVIEGFRFNTDDLRRISTPQLLDELAVNSLGMRFGDAAFGREVYADIKHQAVAAEERWLDARVDATLGIPRVRSVAPNPFFDLLVRWEYTVVPKHRFRKFAVVSDQQRYSQLVAERGETSVWFKPTGTGLEVTDPENFALIEFMVDGEPVEIARTADDFGQMYTVDVGQAAVEAGRAVVMSFTYRSRLRRDGHMVHFDIDRPVRGFSLEMDYRDTEITQMLLVDHVSSTQRARITKAPEVTGAQSYSFSYDGWVLPRAGITFVWQLKSEHLPLKKQRERSSGATQDDAHQARAA